MNAKKAAVWAVIFTYLIILCGDTPVWAAAGKVQQAQDVRQEAGELMSELGLSEMDAYLRQEDIGQLTFSQLVKEFRQHGLSLEFATLGEKLKQAVLSDYEKNRTVLIQILILSIAFSVLLQMTSSLQKSYISNLGFLGVYLVVMLLLLRLFLLLTAVPLT